jgi:putative ABC transport system substrate-binding protein
MTEARDQRSAVRNRRADIMSGDAERAERCPCALFATIVKPISDFRLLISGLCALLFALSFPAEAQQPTKVPRIGFLGAGSSASSASRIEAFRQGLRELGYVEGKNILIEYRYAEEKLDRLPGLATELVRLKVDAIITGGPGVLAAKDASKATPIVMTDIGDPVGVGLVASLAHPGGNVTGLSSLAKELSGKQLELLKEAIPRVSLVAVL